jgi:hypothetical protein
MNCKQAEELLPLYAARDLEEKRTTLVTEHVQTCAACSRVADEYRESVQLTEQFAPPVFSEAVYAGIRQRVLREIETEASLQTIASWFRPKLTWAIVSVLLIIVSMVAIYFIVNRANVEQQLAHKPPVKVQPETTERSNSGPRSVNTGGNKQQLVRVPKPQRKRSRDMLTVRVSPQRDSAALGKTLRVEMQTKDPNIRIIWFVQQETKPIIQGSKGT